MLWNRNLLHPGSLPHVGSEPTLAAIFVPNWVAGLADQEQYVMRTLQKQQIINVTSVCLQLKAALCKCLCLLAWLSLRIVGHGQGNRLGLTHDNKQLQKKKCRYDRLLISSHGLRWHQGFCGQQWHCSGTTLFKWSRYCFLLCFLFITV